MTTVGFGDYTPRSAGGFILVPLGSVKPGGVCALGAETQQSDFCVLASICFFLGVSTCGSINLVDNF